MSSVVPFPSVSRSPTGAVVSGACAKIYILPVVRIERHGESSESTPNLLPPLPAPRQPVGPFFSGGGRTAR
ncbi:hypothetical protein ACLBXM_01620 [Xanthobacteraceae bacterium A53D]